MSLAIRFSRFLDKTPFHSRKSLPPTENPEFVYPPLDEAKREIRYLILLPGKRNDPVRGLLVVAPMTKLDCPNFEALSYVWGSKENSTEVAIKSVSDVEAAAVLENADSVDRTSRRFDSMFGIVRITQNLARALPYLRYLSKPRRLWIDAICINQDDADERSSQVQRMRDVYSLASRVVVWLGPGTADTELAFATLEKINSKFYFDDRRSVVNVISHDPSNVEMDQSVFLTRSEFESLSTLYKSAWFYRLWIWQEIQLANAKSRLKCGEHGMLWQEFCNAVQVLRHQRIFVKSDDGSGSGSGVDDDEWIQWTAHLTHVDRICRFIPNQTSVNLFKATIEAECSNERDRIYGMLALFPKDEITLEANYTQTVEEVYQAAVENYFDNTHSLDIVMLCELCDGSKEKKPNLPGWVPDFSVMRERSEVLSRIITRQGAYYGRRRVVVEGQVLKAPGAKIGAVTGVFQCQVTPGSPEREVAEVLLEAARALNLDLDGEYLTTRETTGKAIARALCLDWFNDRYHPPRTNYWSEATITGLSRLHEARDSELSTEENQFLENGRRWLRRRSVFATDSGHIGLGPASLKVKDLIVNLVGCVMPLALRACPRNQYQHVGEAYCQGAMRGESVLGALPPDIDLVFTNPTRYPAYINRKIGSLQVGDPRLDGVDVPGGWSRVEHEEEDLFTIWREEDTGKEYKGDFFDPRLTIDELEKRGVVFEYFDII